MTCSDMPPFNPILTRYRLKLRQRPIEWIGAHGLKQLSGSVHGEDDTAGNIISASAVRGKDAAKTRGTEGLLWGRT